MEAGIILVSNRADTTELLLVTGLGSVPQLSAQIGPTPIRFVQSKLHKKLADPHLPHVVQQSSDPVPYYGHNCQLGQSPK